MPSLALQAPRSFMASFALGCCPNRSRPRPCPLPNLPSNPRTLATVSRRDVVQNGQEEQVLKRPWWPDYMRTAGPHPTASIPPSSAVRFILELSSHLDPVAAATETDEDGGAKLSASVAVVLRLVSSVGQPLGKELSRRVCEAVTIQQQQRCSARYGEAAPSISEDLISGVFSGQSEARQREGIAVELLYISRTVVGKDGSRDARRWSGQIAFPVRTLCILLALLSPDTDCLA